MPGLIKRNIRYDLGALYLGNIVAAVIFIVYRIPEVGYLLIIASLIGLSGFHHKLNVVAMFSHVSLVSMAFEYAWLLNYIQEDKNEPSSGLQIGVMVYCVLHLLIVINRLLAFYHFTRKRMRRLRRRELKKKDSNEKRSRPISIMLLKEDVGDPDEEPEYDLWQSWQDLFLSFGPKKKSVEVKDSDNISNKS
eukprot:NODE_926_length_3035_cov_0.169959.p1 type:complete len:192 gc:universal NODE_926_length_3035_cov_0.169959:1349-1924(+)